MTALALLVGLGALALAAALAVYAAALALRALRTPRHRVVGGYVVRTPRRGATAWRAHVAGCYRRLEDPPVGGRVTASTRAADVWPDTRRDR